MFTLVSKDLSRLVSLLRAELTSRIAGAIDELKLERQNEVAINLFSAKEGVTSNIFPVANNSAVLTKDRYAEMPGLFNAGSDNLLSNSASATLTP